MSFSWQQGLEGLREALRPLHDGVSKHKSDGNGKKIVTGVTNYACIAKYQYAMLAFIIWRYDMQNTL